MAWNQSMSSGEMGAAPVTASFTSDSPVRSRTIEKATASRKSHVSVCSLVSAPARAATTSSRAAVMPSSRALARAGSADAAAITPCCSFSHTRGTPNMMFGRTATLKSRSFSRSSHGVTVVANSSAA